MHSPKSSQKLKNCAEAFTILIECGTGYASILKSKSKSITRNEKKDYKPLLKALKKALSNDALMSIPETKTNIEKCMELAKTNRDLDRIAELLLKCGQFLKHEMILEAESCVGHILVSMKGLI